METLVETKLTIITTNYDLSLEMGLHWLGASPFLPNVSQFQSRTNGSRKGLYSPSPGTHTLCKLHGSLNWSLDDSGQVIAFDELDHGKQVTHRLSTAKQKVIAERTETLVWPTALQGMLPDNPLIVPPTLFKGEISRHVREAWTTARKAIADSDYLALIGYSFPDSDTYMKYFFASALAARPRPKPVKFVDPNASSIIERLGAPSATSYGSHFIDGLVPIDEKWEDVSRSRLLA